MAILRVTAEWAGFDGAPGYTAFHFMGGGGFVSDAQQVATRVHTAFGNIAPILPDDVRVSVQSEVEEIDESTGMVTGFQAVETPGPVVGSGSGDYSGPVGAIINWRTQDLRFGRRIRGRTFLVPLVGNAFYSTGGIDGNTQGMIQDMASELMGGDIDSELVVWSRPRDGSGGVAATVTSFQVPALAAVLRSRRD